MAVKERLERLARAAAGRPVLTLAVVLFAALCGGALALGLRPNAGSDTFVSRSSESFRASDDFHRRFGDDAVIILIRESLPNLVETKDLATLTQLEACLSGEVVVASQQAQSFVPAPPGAQPAYGGPGSPCAKLMRAKRVQVVYGPGTFLNRAVAAVNTQIQSMLAGMRASEVSAQQAAYQLALAQHLSRAQALQAANAAGRLAQNQAIQQDASLYLNSGISGAPRIDDPQFIPQIVFDPLRGVNQPKARFAYLFPSADSALVQVRLKAGLSDAQRSQAISWIREAVKMPQFASAYGASYTVSGAPVVINDLATRITGSILGLLIAALVIMAATLLVVFRARPRLVPLVLALCATGVTFGITALVGASLTLASIAVLPILIGLAVDYAIQFQSRTQEARSLEGSGSPDGARVAVGHAAAAGAPTIAAAALATATGFLILLLSPIPMVRGFGLLLVIGIVVAFLCALCAGSAALVLVERGGGAIGASLRGAREILSRAGARLRSASPRYRMRRPARWTADLSLIRSGRVLRALTRNPERVLVVGLLLAALGWVADTQTSVESDVTKLVPTNMPALRDLHRLEKVTGVSGEIDVTVRAPDITQPRVVSWMIGYERQLLSHYGYVELKGCARATLCPALSLPDLFSAGTPAGSASQGAGGANLSQGAIRALLASVPSYFSQAVITSDQREATLAFGMRLMPLGRQQRVVEYMRSQMHPPAGVSARLAGLPVLAAEANASLASSSRRLLTLLAGLLAVGLVLMAVFREPRRALVPVVPIALATGWSALILFAIGIPLNPMSATLGALVIAISTEFSVLLSERFRQERAAGHDLADALQRTYGSTGAAVLASGITAIAGFGVLVFSSITMLRDFGFVTLVDLSVSLAGVLVVLPAVLALVERGELAETARGALLRVDGARPRLRRRAGVA